MALVKIFTGTTGFVKCWRTSLARNRKRPISKVAVPYQEGEDSYISGKRFSHSCQVAFLILVLQEFFLIYPHSCFICPYCFTCAKLRTVLMFFFFKNKVLIDRVAAGFPNLRRGSNDAGQSGVSRSSPWPLPADSHEVRSGVWAALVLHVSQAEGLLQSGTARRPEPFCPIDPDREQGGNRPGEEPAHPVYGARVAEDRKSTRLNSR